jgi:hypothetical protein
MEKRFTSMAQERRLIKQMEESGREQLTRRELIEGLIDVINDGIWELSDGELEDFAEEWGLDVKCFKHGIFFVKSLD